MSTYAQVRAAVRDVVDGLTGWTPSTIPLRAEDIPATGADGWFVVRFESGASEYRPAGDDVAQTRHEVAVQWLQQLTTSDWQAQQDRALGRVESVRSALCAHDALADVGCYALFADYALEDAGSYLLVTAGFEVVHTYVE